MEENCKIMDSLYQAPVFYDEEESFEEIPADYISNNSQESEACELPEVNSTSEIRNQQHSLYGGSEENGDKLAVVLSYPDSQTYSETENTDQCPTSICADRDVTDEETLRDNTPDEKEEILNINDKTSIPVLQRSNNYDLPEPAAYSYRRSKPGKLKKKLMERNDKEVKQKHDTTVVSSPSDFQQTNLHKLVDCEVKEDKNNDDIIHQLQLGSFHSKLQTYSGPGNSFPTPEISHKTDGNDRPINNQGLFGYGVHYAGKLSTEVPTPLQQSHTNERRHLHSSQNMVLPGSREPINRFVEARNDIKGVAKDSNTNVNLKVNSTSEIGNQQCSLYSESEESGDKLPSVLSYPDWQTYNETENTDQCATSVRADRGDTDEETLTDNTPDENEVLHINNKTSIPLLQRSINYDLPEPTAYSYRRSKPGKLKKKLMERNDKEVKQTHDTTVVSSPSDFLKTRVHRFEDCKVKEDKIKSGRNAMKNKYRISNDDINAQHLSSFHSNLQPYGGRGYNFPTREISHKTAENDRPIDNKGLFGYGVHNARKPSKAVPIHVQQSYTNGRRHPHISHNTVPPGPRELINRFGEARKDIKVVAKESNTNKNSSLCKISSQSPSESTTNQLQRVLQRIPKKQPKYAPFNYLQPQLTNARSHDVLQVRQRAERYALEKEQRVSSPWRKVTSDHEPAMQVPPNSVGVWKFGENNFFTTVPNVWSVSDCIAHVRNRLGSYGYGELDLWNMNGNVTLAKRKSLTDYPGLKKLHIVRRPHLRNPHPSHQTSLPDLTDPYDDDTRVLMSCQHAITPENLFNYVWSKITSGATDITCPAIPDMDRPAEQCCRIWDFKEVSLLACLSDDEMSLFTNIMFRNWMDKNKNVYICPQCNDALLSECPTNRCITCQYCSYTFCTRCSDRVNHHLMRCLNDECQQSLSKLRTLLQTCPVRNLVGVPNCPSVRACPLCQFVIEYDEEDSCKHMTCPRNTCQAKFCFICLKVKTDKYYWPCGGAFDQCTPAPRQAVE